MDRTIASDPVRAFAEPPRVDKAHSGPAGLPSDQQAIQPSELYDWVRTHVPGSAEAVFIGGNGFNSPKLGTIAGEAADGTLVGSPWFVGKKDPANIKFVADFKTKYNEEPDQFAAQAYDTLHIVAKAINAAGAPESEKIRESLGKTTHTGVMGPFSFSPDRDPADTSGVVVLVMKGGRFEELQ